MEGEREYEKTQKKIKKTKFKLEAIKLPKKITWKKNNLCTYQNPK